MQKLRDYQVCIANNANNILKSKGFVYLAVEVRCGKTLMALETCKLFGAKKVLFITKIKAFSSIQNDYNIFGYTFELQIINKESIHKVKDNDFDIVICDEAHGLFSTFPKPNQFTKIYKSRFSKIPSILLSGTMSPESYSQLFHQFWINNYSPFKHYSNFYKWAKDFVNVKQILINGLPKNDYKDADKSKIDKYIKDIVLTFTQAEAGFVSKVEEVVLEVEMQEITKNIINRLKKDKIVQNKSGQVILGDTAVKLMQKEHQLWSGTCKFEDGSSKTIDNTKAVFIQNHFKGKKIAIFYKFKEELIMLQNQFGTKLTTDLEEFNATNKNIALQFISGREGLSLRNADYIVALNIDFSATTYFQFKDRMTTMERKENTIYWIFTKGGIEKKIYNTVQQKKNFTLSIYLK